MMDNLNAINQADAGFAQAHAAAVAAQDSTRPVALPQGQSFASAMDNASSSKVTAMAQLAKNGGATSRLPALVTPRASAQTQIEQVLGDTLGVSNARALAQLSELMNTGGDSNFDVARNVVSSRSVLATLSGQVVQSPTGYNSNSIRRSITPPAGSEPVAVSGKNAVKATSQADAFKTYEQAVSGTLSSQFESGEAGIAAIGYDSHGGTSYGKYQISSKAGSMDHFIKFLRSESPAYAKRLAAAGEANTGSKSGAMPNEWKKIAKENPALFEDLQERFIHDSHYKPALQAVSQRTGLSGEHMSPALQEVLWSTAVQHGPNGAARIFSRAMAGLDENVAKNPGTEAFEKAMIENVYAARSTQFGSSTQRVQNAVQNRLEQEKGLALAMVEAIAV